MTTTIQNTIPLFFSGHSRTLVKNANTKTPVSNVFGLKIRALLDKSTFISQSRFDLSAVDSQGDIQINFTFKLNEQYLGHAQVLRGLFLLSQPEGSTLSYDRHERAFQLQVDVSREDAASGQLKKAFALFEEEVSFKAQLKNVLKIERRLRNQINALYAS